MVLKMVLKILLLKDKKKDKKFVKLLIILIMAFKIWKKIVNLVLFSSKQKILGLLGGIEIRYWNLVLVFSLRKKSIRNFNTTFQYLPVNFSSISRNISVNIAKFHQFHGKIIKITHIAWKWAVLTKKFVFCCFHGKNHFWYQKIQ